MEEHSRYLIGIDLGTTNSSVAYIDLAVADHSRLNIQPFMIPQLTTEGVVTRTEALPSFRYLAQSNEFPEGALQLPWGSQVCVGLFAKEQGGRIPSRLVRSAKSWLCHPACDRRDRILPVEASAEKRISPVEATASYLQHIRESWNHLMARNDASKEFEQQEIVLTVPASFDEVARALTVEAAKLAGFGNMTLLEEPQAAFYSWIASHRKQWERELSEGETILVCDVGGGTTDFSLITVVESSGELGFQRMAVGNHLLLGGDNMDEAICCYLEDKLGQELNTTQRQQLRFEARRVKEELLAENAPSSSRVLVQGSGSSVIGGTISGELTADELDTILVGGFFRQSTFEEASRIQKKSALRAMGLPYESEPSILKQMAAFLQASGKDGPVRPDAILFNGGTMKPAKFQQSCLDAITHWFPDQPAPRLLETASLDLAVSRGAAYFGQARRGLGVRIGGGSSRSYYLGIEVEGKLQGVTLVPRGSEEGSRFLSEQTFHVTSNTPVSFPLYSSNTRLEDSPGDILDIDPAELHALPPIQTVLRFGKQDSKEKVPVKLVVALTEIGTLALWLESQNTSHRWELEFQLRTASGQEDAIAVEQERQVDEVFDQGHLDAATELIEALFVGEKGLKPSEIVGALEKALGQSRWEWSPSLLRGLWSPLLQQAEARKRSPAHEARWWNLAGFFLRPGTGHPLDDHRMKELWRVLLSDGKRAQNGDVEIQRWICLRRVSLGLSKGQQGQLLPELLDGIWNKSRGRFEIKGKKQEYPYSERVRAVASMELIDGKWKRQLGDALLSRIEKGAASDADYWALSRIGARQLLYGSVPHAVPSERVEAWLKRLVAHYQQDPIKVMAVIEALARKTEQRDLNISDEATDKLFDLFSEEVEKEGLRQRLMAPSALTRKEQERSFGDQLPIGLTLES